MVIMLARIHTPGVSHSIIKPRSSEKLEFMSRVSIQTDLDQPPLKNFPSCCGLKLRNLPSLFVQSAFHQDQAKVTKKVSIQCNRNNLLRKCKHLIKRAKESFTLNFFPIYL